MTDDTPEVTEAYDALAGAYDGIEDDPYGANLEFPAMVDLLPDVEGTHALDAGCGRGRYAEWLSGRGADVVALDASTEMVRHARERLGDGVDVRRADLSEPLALPDGAFDLIVSGLALHYLPDWRPTFREFARVLKPGGTLVFSAHHPVDDQLAYGGTYFDVERQTMELETPDGPVTVPFYVRPLAEVVNPLVDAGFRIDEVVEPTPTEGFREKKPESYEKRLKQPTFLCVRATKS